MYGIIKVRGGNMCARKESKIKEELKSYLYLGGVVVAMLFYGLLNYLLTLIM